MRCADAWCLVCFCYPCCRRRCRAATSTPFTLADQGGILVSVLLNGTGPFLMLIDTGANHSAIAEDVAVRIGAPVIAQAVVTSAAGTRMRTMVRVERLELGPISVGADATILPRDSLAELGASDGVIGQDVLATLRYTIDFDSRQIIWHAGAASTLGARAVLNLKYLSGRYLVELPQRGSVLRLVPDSGAGGLVLFQGAGRVLPELVGTRGYPEWSPRGNAIVFEHGEMRGNIWSHAIASDLAATKH